MTVQPVPAIERDGGSLGAAVAALWELTLLLREHCPWDIAQNAATIVPHTLEEAWEVADVARAAQAAVDAGAHPDLGDFEDELGDLLFQVCFLAMWCREQEPSIDLESVVVRNFTKLVRRHPHVFGAEATGADADANLAAETVDDVLTEWNRIKRTREDRGLFDGIPKAMPALGRARKTQQKAATIGFDFDSARAALDKLDEEVGELRAAIDAAEAAGTLPRGKGDAADAQTASELGDVLFAAANVARLTNVDPEFAVEGSTSRFRGRVETAMALAEEAGVAFADLDLDAQEQWYQRAKAQLGSSAT
ncbi:MAG: MazG family protein [Thermoleophilia bacterium]|nr:MazG family protein [Thermoleophilia bacterium]